MNTNQTESDLLRSLFRRLPEEKLPSAFQQEMMMRIRKEAIRTRRRNRILLVAAYTFALAMFAGLTIVTFVFLDIPKIEIPRISISSVYIFLGIISIVLLLADYIFRRSFYKKHPELE